MPEEAPIRHRGILSGLRDMGLKKGDIVLAHSSLSEFGNVEGGPDTVIDALLETVGDDADLQEVYDTERQLLYVACTRARDHLLVTGVNPASEFLDDFMGGDKVSAASSF